MAIPKWQKEVEAILRERYQGDDLSEQIKRVNELISMIEIAPPRDDYGEIAFILMKLASEELPLRAAIYSGFMLGVAYERCRKGGA